MTKRGEITDFDIHDLPCGCIVADASRRISFSNQYMADQFGWNSDEVKGRGVEKLMTRASQMFCESYVYPMLIQDGECNEVQLTIESPKGERIPAIINVKRFQEDAAIWSVFSAKNRDKLYEELVGARNQLEIQAKQLKQLAMVDDLTGLMNRRALNEAAEKAFAVADRMGNSIAITLIDIDDFKKINDTYGHNFGDNVLRKVGASLAENCRSSELVGRIGGEEFVFVLHSDTHINSAAFADRVHRAVKQALKDDLPITISIGIASRFGRIGPSFIELLGRADKALYEAKATGKNKTVIGETFQTTDLD